MNRPAIYKPRLFWNGYFWAPVQYRQVMNLLASQRTHMTERTYFRLVMGVNRLYWTVSFDEARPASTCLTQANGWGSAGQCPASMRAKTPATQQLVIRLAATDGSGRIPVSETSASGLRAATGGGVG